MDPDSPRAQDLARQKVQGFLDRHGFDDVHGPRDTSDVHQKVRIEPLYPLEVAEQLGDERMLNLLKQLGARPRGQGFLKSSWQIIRRVLVPSSRDHQNGPSHGAPRSCLIQRSAADPSCEERLQTVWA